MNEKFLREIGLKPAESTSRNPLESAPALSDSVGWLLGEETLSLTGEAVKVEGRE
jgi:hypothetical protein